MSKNFSNLINLRYAKLLCKQKILKKEKFNKLYIQKFFGKKEQRQIIV